MIVSAFDGSTLSWAVPRQQLILDYMNLDGTSLDDDVRIVTYGCGERFPLESEAAEVAEEAEDDQEVQFDRRVEVFFFAKPFGILPPVRTRAGINVPRWPSRRPAGEARRGGILDVLRRRATKPAGMDRRPDRYGNSCSGS